MTTSILAIVGGVVGGVILLLIIIVISWFCLSQYRKLSKQRNSETGSSAPSLVELKRGGGGRSFRQYGLDELEQATRNFHESNLIGFGSFGMVYKGLLCDGTVVAIKKHIGTPFQEFIEEVKNLSRIQHRHVVNLVGFCQENGFQILMYEYLPNGSICNHLYDTGKDEATKLEFKQRLSISVGAAKDAGIRRLLQKIEDAGPSSSSGSNINPFRDPELVQTDGRVYETSDLYSFGIFLLELITGKDTSNIEAFRLDDTIVHYWVKEHVESNELVDERLDGSFTEEGMTDFVKLILQCIVLPGRLRPTMEMVVTELQRILEKEIMLTTITVEGTGTVTLGSQLFTK